MSEFETVKNYLSELGLNVTLEDAEGELVIVNEPSRGFQHLVIDCESPILVIEQFLFDVKDSLSAEEGRDSYRRLLQMNRDLVHGAFALDDSGKKLLFRDTLQLANLDLNELEGSLNALSLALAENAEELLSFANCEESSK